MGELLFYESRKGKYVMEKKMKMQLFGNFCLSNQQAMLDEEMLRSDRLTRLLIYVLIHRDKLLSNHSLIDLFWKEDSKRPEGALKNLVYRLRRALKIFGDEEYICTIPGGYRWNPDIPVETDYEEFERLVAEARAQESEEKKRELGQRAIASFNGSVSSKIDGELWILNMVTWYRSQYMDIVKMLGSIYERAKEWDALEALCNNALSVDALDEDVHYWIIKSLYGKKKYDLAMSHYDKTKKLLADSLGISNSEKLQSIFREMCAAKPEKNTTSIRNLIEEACEKEEPKGAFLCDYQMFLQIYRLETRRIKRLGLVEYIMLLTVQREGEVRQTAVIDSGLIDGMNILEEQLRVSLRVGDVAARCSPTQFIVLLPTCTYEAAVRVAKRIRRGFQKHLKKKKIEMIYELEEVSAFG